MLQSKSIIINFRGGIISPGYLKDILNVASGCLATHACFGLRQQLLVNIPAKKYKEFIQRCMEKNISFYEADKAAPNMVSSYCAVNIFTGESWLSEGVYKDVFDLFHYQPSLKINICDSKQSLVPFFSGHINWVSSDQSHFWHLAIRFPGTGKIYNWPELVYTNDIANVSAAIEREINAGNRTNLFNTIKQLITCISKPVKEMLALPVFHLPYYEGFNKAGDSSWLGIYRRDELFPVNFLREVCTICLDSKIGQFYTTSWKSIIVKGIHDTGRKNWDHILGSYRINVRHAANELNWQVEDNNEDGLILKRHIIRHFDIEDVRTYGLSFAVKTRVSPGIFGSVIISKQPAKNNARLKSMDRFEIMHTRDFNPNSTDLVSFRKDVGKEHLGTYLVSLCKFFYEQGNHGHYIEGDPGKQSAPEVLHYVYQCSHCLTVYDESTGEPENNIPAGTGFSALPAGYACPLCEAAKDEFKKVDSKTMLSDNFTT